MLPVLFEVVVPAGLGKLVAVLLVLLVAALRALAHVRRARREGERIDARNLLGSIYADTVTTVIIAKELKIYSRLFFFIRLRYFP